MLECLMQWFNEQDGFITITDKGLQMKAEIWQAFSQLYSRGDVRCPVSSVWCNLDKKFSPLLLGLLRSDRLGQNNNRDLFKSQ